MWVTIDNTCYREKPHNMGVVTNRIKEGINTDITISQLANSIENGQAFMQGKKTNTEHTIDAGTLTDIGLIILDFDSGIEPKQASNILLKKLDITPSLYYPSYSYTKKIPRFRLIYELKENIQTRAEYEQIYKKIVSLYEGCVDARTCNINRIWLGTKFKVKINPTPKVITQTHLKDIRNIKIQEEGGCNIKLLSNSLKIKTPTYKDYYRNVNLKLEKINEICDWIKYNANLLSYLETVLGFRYQKNGNRLTGCCPIHGGDNQRAFNYYINSDTCYCFSKGCPATDIIEVVRYVNGINTVEAIKQILNLYKLVLPEIYRGI